MSKEFWNKTCYAVWDKIWKLTIVEKQYRWRMVTRKCICECGNATYKRSNVLNRDGENAICPKCTHKKIREDKHICDKRFYKIYQGLKSRCWKHKNYKNVKCKWSTYEEFYNDMYESYVEHVKKYGEKQTTIDRIDNNWDYCKENCRWATYQEQLDNRKNTVWLEYNWETHTVVQWCKILWVKEDMLRTRISKWIPISYTVEHPWRITRPWKFEYNWETHTLKERSEKIWVAHSKLTCFWYNNRKKWESFWECIELLKNKKE